MNLLYSKFGSDSWTLYARDTVHILYNRYIGGYIDIYAEINTSELVVGNTYQNVIGHLPENISIGNLIAGRICSCMLDAWVPFDCVCFLSIDSYEYGAKIFTRINKLASSPITKFRFGTFLPSNNIWTK